MDAASEAAAAAAVAKSLQSCLTLCDAIDGSPTGSPVPGILQARTLEWVAISFSNAQGSGAPGEAGRGLKCVLRAPRSGCTTQGSNLGLLHWQVDFFTAEQREMV